MQNFGRASMLLYDYALYLVLSSPIGSGVHLALRLEITLGSKMVS